MIQLNSKLKIIFISVTLGIVLIYFFLRIIDHKSNSPTLTDNKTLSSSQNNQNDSPRIVSTKPDPLDNAIIPADQVIEIPFHRPLENVGEFKVKIEPKVEVKIELSGDRKTGKITPVKAYELGSGYRLYIGPDSKFDGVGEWGQDKSFQFRTIKYNGV